MRLGEKGQGGKATEASELDREVAGSKREGDKQGKGGTTGGEGLCDVLERGVM